MLHHSCISTLVACALVFVGACADLLDIAENPQLIPPDPWACKPSEAAALPAAIKETATVKVHVCDFISSNCGTAVTGLKAKLCNKLDVTCMNPIQSGIVDIEGDLTFEVPTRGSLGEGFDGYLLVEGPTTDCTKQDTVSCTLVPECDPTAPSAACQVPVYITGLLFFNPPITADTVQPIVLPFVPNLAALALIGAAGARGTVDRTLGSVFITALDCDGRPAPGLTFATSKGLAQYATLYLSNGTVMSSATSTDVSGTGGLLGVPSGFVTISAFPVGTTREVASFGVQIVPGTVTYVTLVPPRD